MKTSLRHAAKPQHRSRPRVSDRPYPKTRPSGQHPRRQFLRLAVGAAALPAVSCGPEAQSYPTRPITMIDPYAAGDSSDLICRILAERMRSPLGQPVIIENVGGADGSIGVGRAARARPDGYTVVFGGLGTFVLNSAFYSLPYDVLNDFAPISLVYTVPYVLFARKTIPAKDLNQFISWLKANPGEASAGISASVARIPAASFEKEKGTRFTIVPYRGGAPLVQDLVAVHLGIDLRMRLWNGAEEEAVRVFAVNLRDLLLAAPAGARATMGLDPGYRTGVKVAVVDSTGKVVTTSVIYPHEPRRQWNEALAILGKLAVQHKGRADLDRQRHCIARDRQAGDRTRQTAARFEDEEDRGV
jgi:hypothetical protein